MMIAPIVTGSIHHSSPHRITMTKSPSHAHAADVDKDVTEGLGELKITPKDLNDEPSIIPRVTMESSSHTLLDTTTITPSPPPKSYKPGSGGTAEDDACNLFIGDLARSVTEDQIRERFAGHGEIMNVDIKRDKMTHNNLGYGFVQFKTKEQAQAAKKAMNGIELGNRVIRLGWAQKNTTLFVGDLDGTVTTEQLQDAFKEFGPLILEETFVKAGSGKYGFVRFQNRCDAERAKQEMNRKIIGTRQCRIGWGENNVQKHCVHVQFNPNMGPTLTEQMLTQFFSQYGTIVNVSLPRYANNKHKGYAFVHYPDGEEGETSAHNAISAAQDTVMFGLPIHLSYGKKQATTTRRTGSTSSNGSTGGGTTSGGSKFKSRGSASSTSSNGTSPYKQQNSIQQSTQVQAQTMYQQQPWMMQVSPGGWQPIPVMNAYQQQLSYYQQDGRSGVYLPQYYASTPTSNGATSPGFAPNVFFQAATSPYGASYSIPETSPISPQQVQQPSPVYTTSTSNYTSTPNSPYPNYTQQPSPLNNIYQTTQAASVR